MLSIYQNAYCLPTTVEEDYTIGTPPPFHLLPDGWLERDVELGCPFARVVDEEVVALGSGAPLFEARGCVVLAVVEGVRGLLGPGCPARLVEALGPSLPSGIREPVRRVSAAGDSAGGLLPLGPAPGVGVVGARDLGVAPVLLELGSLLPERGAFLEGMVPMSRELGCEFPDAEIAGRVALLLLPLAVLEVAGVDDGTEGPGVGVPMVLGGAVAGPFEAFADAIGTEICLNGPCLFGSTEGLRVEIPFFEGISVRPRPVFSGLLVFRLGGRDVAPSGPVLRS
jgi:hypothetical protein